MLPDCGGTIQGTRSLPQAAAVGSAWELCRIVQCAATRQTHSSVTLCCLSSHYWTMLPSIPGDTSSRSPPLVLLKAIVPLNVGGWMICHFSNISVHSIFCSMNFIILFPFLIIYYNIIFIIIVFWLGLLLFVPALLLSTLTPLFLPSSSVSLSYFVLAVSMRECLGKHSCMSSPCPIAILNGTFLFREAK